MATRIYVALKATYASMMVEPAPRTSTNKDLADYTPAMAFALASVVSAIYGLVIFHEAPAPPWALPLTHPRVFQVFQHGLWGLPTLITGGIALKFALHENRQRGDRSVVAERSLPWWAGASLGGLGCAAAAVSAMDVLHRLVLDSSNFGASAIAGVAFLAQGLFLACYRRQIRIDHDTQTVELLFARPWPVWRYRAHWSSYQRVTVRRANPDRSDLWTLVLESEMGYKPMMIETYPSREMAIRRAEDLREGTSWFLDTTER